MIRVRLNENSVVDVNTDNPQEAAAAARRWFQQNRPEEFTTWRNSQLGLGSSAVRSASAGIDDFQANLYAAAEGLGRAVSLPSLENFGREGRIANQREAEAAFPEALRQSFLDSEGVGDVARATTEAVGGSLPSSGASMAGALTGARLGAPLGLPGIIGGAILGGAVPSFAGSAGSNIRRQIETSGDITSPGAAFGTAAIQAPLESAADVATLGAARVLRRPVTEAAQAVGAGLGSRVGRGALAGATTETPVEVVQTALERAQAGLPTSPSDPEARREYLEAGLGGLTAGAITGGTLGGVFGQRPAPPADTTTTPDTPIPPTGEGPAPASAPIEEPVAGGRPAPLVMPERPEAFVTPEEAEAFVAENPNFTPPTTLTTPEAAVGFINAARVADWEQQSQQVRQQAITEFFPRAPDTNLPLVSEALSNIAVAANQGNLNLNAFSPTAATRAVLAARDIDPTLATRDDIRLVTAELKALEEAGVIRKNTVTEPPAKGKKGKKRPTTTYSINYGATTSPQPTPTAQPAPAPAPAAEAAPTPAPVEATPQAESPVAGEAVAPAPAPAAVPVKPEDEQALWRAYTLNVGPQVSSPFVAAARNIARIRGRGLNRQEFTEFAQQFGNAPTPEVRDQIVNDAVNRPVSPTADTPAEAVRQADPGSGAGTPTQTLEEAVFTTPENLSVKSQQRILDKQIADGFRGGFFGKWFASPVATFGKQPTYKATADQMDKLYVRNHQPLNEVTQLFEPALTLSAASQARIALTLQETRSRQQMWDRGAFTAEENAAMEGILQAGQRMLDYVIDSYTHRYFNPSNAKTPQERAALEAFQQRKGDRLITQMNDAEIRAASPDGAAEVRRLDARRDKFFFPQISRGTHFVAAYERLPGGKERLARIYFYDPVRNIRKLRQKVGIQRDPEAASIKALRAEFPDASRYRVMTRGIESENDARATDLRRDGDFIAQYLQELSKVSGKEATRIIARMSKEIDKAQVSKIFRPYNDLLRAVTPEYASDYIRDTIPAYFISASKIQARRYIQDDFNKSLEGYSNEEKAYWNDLLDYSTTPTEAFGTGRALAFFMFLGFNTSTALIQLTQNPTVLLPRLLRDGGGALSTTRHFTSAARDVYGTLDSLRIFGKELEQVKRLIDRGVLTADEATALQRALKEGRLNPVQAVELRSTVAASDLRNYGIADRDATAFAGGFNKVLDLSGRMLATVDETNRATAFLAAYRLAKSRPSVISRASKLDNRNYKDAYEYAEGVVSDTNFRSTKEDRPLIQRFHPVAEVMTQFMSPVFKLMELYARSAKQTVEGLRSGDLVMARAAALQFAAMTASQVALAGIWSLPLAERLREIVEGILKLVFDDVVDFEQELEKATGNGFLSSILNYGFPHANGSISLSSRLKIDPFPQGTVSEWDALALLGPVGGLFQKVGDGYNAWRLGDYWGLSFAMLPTAFANVAKGAQLAIDEEQFTKRQGRIITPEQVRQAGESGFLSPAAQQAIGFPPPEFVDIRRTAQRARELEMATRDPTERANIELSRIVLDMFEAQAAGRDNELDALRRRYDARKAEILRDQQGKPPEQQIRINDAAVIQRARQDFVGRGAPETLIRQAPVPARQAIQEMTERSLWRDRQ